MCVHLNKEDSQATMTLTDNKEETQRKTKDMMAHALASTTLTDVPSVSGHFTHCWAFRSALRVTNSIVLNVPDVLEFLREIYQFFCIESILLASYDGRNL